MPHWPVTCRTHHVVQFYILSLGPPDNGHQMLPVSHAIILDPWIEPLPTPGPAPYAASSSATTLFEGKHPSNDLRSLQSGETQVDVAAVTENGGRAHDKERQPAPPRLLVINSEKFTLWNSHFSRLREVVETWEPQGRCLLTLGECPVAHGSPIIGSSCLSVSQIQT